MGRSVPKEDDYDVVLFLVSLNFVYTTPWMQMGQFFWRHSSINKNKSAGHLGTKAKDFLIAFFASGTAMSHKLSLELNLGYFGGFIS